MEYNFSDLNNKNIVLSGGNGIIGTDLIEKFKEHNSNIFIIDINNKNESNNNIHKIKGDITSIKDLNFFYSFVKSKTKHIDVLINNAATKTSNLEKYFENFEEYDIETWNEVINVNVTGAFLMTQTFSSLLKESSKNPCIINVSSIYGHLAPDKRIYSGAKYLGKDINTPACYSVSKAALNGLTNYLSTYWSEYNIRSNSISPGGIYSGQNQEFIKNYSKRIPLNRMAQVNEISNTILYLSSSISSYINGQNIVVDGGLSVW